MRLFIMALTSLLLLGFSTQSFAHAQLMTSATSHERLPQVTIGARGYGKTFSTFIDDSVAQRMLPQGLELAPSDEFPQGQHLISVMIIKQLNFSVYAGKIPVPLHPYFELVVAIHHVRKIGGKSIFWTFQRVYVDSIPALVGGRYFGYNKFLAHFKENENGVDVVSLKHAPIASLQFKKIDKFDPEAFNKNQALIRKEVSYPVIGNLLGKFAGKFVCSQFDWQFETSVSYPIETSWKFAPGFFGDVANTEIPASSDSSSFNSYLESSWKLTGPFGCAD